MLRTATAESWSRHTTPELTAAVLDEVRDPREPADPLATEPAASRVTCACSSCGSNLGRAADEDTDLLAPDAAVSARQASVTVLDDWHRSGCTTPRPPGHLRTHVPPPDSPWRRRLAPSVYNLVFDPDDRPLRVRLRRPYGPRGIAASGAAMPSRFIVGVPEHVHRQLEAGQISGRAVVVPQDCPSAPDHETGRHVRWTPHRRCF